MQQYGFLVVTEHTNSSVNIYDLRNWLPFRLTVW